MGAIAEWWYGHRGDIFDIQLLLILLAVACFWIWTIAAASPELTEGVVVEKIYTPARTRMQTIWNGKAAIRRKVHRSASYDVRVQGVNEDGKTVTEIWGVTAEEYTRLSVGDTITRKD